jgi:hypothetical protein
MQLAANAAQVEKFQDKASRNASLVAKATVSNNHDKEDAKVVISTRNKTPNVL